MINLIAPILTIIFSVILILRFKKLRKLKIFEYLLIIAILISGSYFMIQQVSSISVKNKLKQKINIITKTTEQNKNDSLKTKIERLEFFVNTIENVDLSDTPEDFRIAYENYCKEFRKTLDLSKEKNELYFGNEQEILKARDHLMSIYSKY